MLHGIRKEALEKVFPRGTRSRPKARPPVRLSDEVNEVPPSERGHHSLVNSRRAGAQGKKQTGSCVLIDPEHSNFDNAGYEIIKELQKLSKSWTHKNPKQLSYDAAYSLDIVGPGEHVVNVTYFPDGYPAVAKRYVVVYKRMRNIDDPEFDPLANDAPIDCAVVEAMNEEAHAVLAGTLIQPTANIADESVPEAGGANESSDNVAANESESVGSPDVEETDDDATEVLNENEVVANAYDRLDDSDDDVFVAPLADDDDTVTARHQSSQKSGTDLDGAPETVNATIDSPAPVNDSMNLGDDSTNARFQWLEKRNARLQTALDLKKETLDEKSAEVAALKDQLDTKEKELTLSRAENIELKHQVDGLQETLARKEKELEAKKIEASNLGRELKAAQVQLAEASGSSTSNAENESPAPIKLADGPLKRAFLSKQTKIDSLEKELTAMKASAKREKRKFDEDLRKETSKRLKAEEEAASCKSEIAKLERINFELKCNKEKDGA